MTDALKKERIESLREWTFDPSRLLSAEQVDTIRAMTESMPKLEAYERAHRAKVALHAHFDLNYVRMNCYDTAEGVEQLSDEQRREIRAEYETLNTELNAARAALRAMQ